MKHRYIAAMILGFSILSRAQSVGSGAPVYSFKGNRLGMYEADFMQANGGWSLWVDSGKPNAFGKRKNKHLEPTPFCSDHVWVENSVELGNLRDGEVICDPSPSFANPEGVEINGRKVTNVRYHFYKDRLYMITILFDADRFAEISGSFRGKYGESSSIKTNSFQNRYGAR